MTDGQRTQTIKISLYISLYRRKKIGLNWQSVQQMRNSKLFVRAQTNFMLK